jgi:RNA recognition motif-containing protein
MNIYVGSLSYKATEEDLKKEFEGFGQVESVNIIKDRYSLRGIEVEEDGVVVGATSERHQDKWVLSSSLGTG